VSVKTIAGAVIGVALLTGATPARADGNVDDGKQVFAKCKACHLIEGTKNTIGPNLHGVIGRKAAGVDSYKYSTAMAQSGLTWDDATLDKYLADPKAVVPNGKMVFPGLKTEKERQDVIAYLRAEAK
jgi:cytochrome c2